MAADFIPSNHDLFKTALEQFEAWLVANGAAWGFAAGEITDFTTKKNAAGWLGSSLRAPSRLRLSGDAGGSQTRPQPPRVIHRH